MRRRTISRLLLTAIVAIGTGLLPLPEPALVGPLRPAVTNVAEAQYYGTARRVGRRTARRTSRRHAAYYGAGAGYYDTVVAEPVPVGTPVATALPAGCTPVTAGGVAYQQCGSTRYRAYMQGDQLVYIPE